ncbi:hypothetical protein [Trinickia symbiotica]|uniref:Uncharacterized protein n=1 Tax=Trinickia symbiotica TaxID=863227 RepID=A0A2N7XA40_9BURK|nr:hypothetical protein [Trinickia symbiotica]PMS38481.1 hypothetical protein C0Z20_00935 [Trinickia symbiotica]
MKTRPKKTIIGTAECHCCGREIPVKQSETGTLDMSCQWCDLPMYAKAGTEAHKRLMERVKLNEQPRTAPELVTPSKAPETEPKPAARAARSAFDLLVPGRA